MSVTTSYLNYNFPPEENIKLVIEKGAITTQSWEENYHKIQKIQLSSKDLVAFVGTIATLSLAIILSFGVSLVAGMAVAVSAIIPFFLIFVFENERQHYQDIRVVECENVFRIYIAMKTYITEKHLTEEVLSSIRRAKLTFDNKMHTIAGGRKPYSYELYMASNR